ncbi:ABC-2 family transporter protein [Streptomyces violaceoruber]|uniref:ABC transporter permease n=1 Tax=Streptomyces violaceoruber TaxID=1935 RepID=UPI001F1C83A4|nr:ABC-2 family transporter protein [Streptomyces violaceoruber]MCF3165776.1 ABC-2 family transporter protein [Streptomyces violaceoruber]
MSSSTTTSRPLITRRETWRVALLIPVCELSYPGRIAARCVMIAIQISLYYWLWIALYASDGGDAAQICSYSAMAILLSRVRWTARYYSREAVPARIREGTIAYWFVRPLDPPQYYFLRGIGEAGLGASVALLGYLVCLAVGVVQPPDGVLVGLASLAAVALGQCILYYLGLLLDLTCFWLVTNDSVKHIYVFVQDLLSGALLPLWLFPGWLEALADVLPFKAAIYQPLALYVGRAPLESAVGLFTIQILWLGALAVLTRFLWRRASLRVMVQGG